MSGFGYDVLGFGSGAVADDPPEVDAQFNRTGLLAHFDGANNGTNNAFNDGSSSNHTITSHGVPAQGSFSPFSRPDGDWSVAMRGDGDDHVICTPDPNAFGTSDFTFECFVMILKLGAYHALADSRADFTQGPQIDLYINNDNKLYLQVSGAHIFEGDTALEAGVWYHIAVCRSSSVTKAFINGTQTASGTDNTNYVASSANRANLGGGSYSSKLLNGFISNLRVVKRALYTGNFTAPTSKLTAVSNTELLTFQSNRFVDNSSEGHTLTTPATTKATASTFSPFLTNAAYDPAVNGASASFDFVSGGGDYLTIANSSDFNFASNPFTISFWIFNVGLESGGNIFGRYANGKKEAIIAIASAGNYANTGALEWRGSFDGTNYNSDHLTANTVVSYNQWNHITITRTVNGSDSIFKTYVNAALVKTTNISGVAIYNTSQETYIMRYSPQHTDYPTGYLCDFKLVNGTATAPSAVPTAPATNTTNTKLLLNMANGQAIDSVSRTSLTLQGNTKLSTGQSKFGSTSLLFDGTDDYAKAIFYESFGMSNFTVECFFRVSNASNNQNLFQFAQSFLPSNDGGPGLGIRSGRWRLYTGSNTATLHASAGPSNNTWYHVAIVRVATTTKLYVDGVETISVSDSFNYNIDNYPRRFLLLGGGYDGNYDLNGYIDEFRVSLMARYTSNNFTPPDEPFPSQGKLE